MNPSAKFFTQQREGGTILAVHKVMQKMYNGRLTESLRCQVKSGEINPLTTRQRYVLGPTLPGGRIRSPVGDGLHAVDST